MEQIQSQTPAGGHEATRLSLPLRRGPYQLSKLGTASRKLSGEQAALLCPRPAWTSDLTPCLEPLAWTLLFLIALLALDLLAWPMACTHLSPWLESVQRKATQNASANER